MPCACLVARLCALVCVWQVRAATQLATSAFHVPDALGTGEGEAEAPDAGAHGSHAGRRRAAVAAAAAASARGDVRRVAARG